MTQVAEQAVTDINGRAGDAAQGLAQGHPGAGALQAKARGRQHGSGHAKAAAKYIQRQGRVSESTADIQIVPRTRARAQQRLRASILQRHLAKNRDANVERPPRGVAANEFAAMFVGQRQQAAGEGAQPDLIHAGQRQGQCESQRRSATGGQVTQVNRQRLVPQGARLNRAEKMLALDQHIAGDRQLHTGARL